MAWHDRYGCGHGNGMAILVLVLVLVLVHSSLDWSRSRAIRAGGSLRSKNKVRQQQEAGGRRQEAGGRRQEAGF